MSAKDRNTDDQYPWELMLGLEVASNRFGESLEIDGNKNQNLL